MKFYLRYMVHLRPLTPRIRPMSSYTHKMAIVSWPMILWRHLTLCIWMSVLFRCRLICICAIFSSWHVRRVCSASCLRLLSECAFFVDIHCTANTLQNYYRNGLFCVQEIGLIIWFMSFEKNETTNRANTELRAIWCAFISFVVVIECLLTILYPLGL